MTDKESEIEHLQSTKDDENEWGEPVAPPVRRRLDAVVSVRFTAGELERIRAAAPDGNVSNFIRTATLDAISAHSNESILNFIFSTSSSQNVRAVSSYSVFSSPSEVGPISDNFSPPWFEEEYAS
jgi:hypothetical protein